MTFEELSVYLHEPKPQEPRSFTEADITSENLLFRRDQVEVHLQEVLSLHQGISKSLRVIPHPRYSPVAFHIHDFYELMYVYKGTVCHHLKDTDIMLRETDAILLPPGTGHSVEAVGGEDLAVSIILPPAYFTPDILGQMTRLERLTAFLQQHHTNGSYLLWHGNGSTQLMTYANSFLCEAFDPDVYSGAAMNAGLLLFLTALERLNPADGAGRQRSIHADIDRIVEYIQQSFSTVTLHDLSNRFGYSENYLSRTIKSRLGISFNDFRHQQCMRQSAFLLASTDYSVRQIAQEVGLSNLTFFYKLFDRYYGMSPAEYRQSYRNAVDGV